MPKRILIFSLTYLPFIGGAEIALKEITDRLSEEDYEFDLITLQFDRSLPRVEKTGNITVHRLGFGSQSPTMGDLIKMPLSLNKYLFPFFAWRQAVQLHKKKSYDAAWAMMANYAGFAAFFFKYTFPKVRFLLTLQEGDPIEHIKHRVRFVYPLFKAIFKKADAVQAISQYLGDFGTSMGFAKTPAVIPNGVDLVRFSREFPPQEIKSLRHDLGLSDTDRVLITTSRLVPKNGIDDCIHALTGLPSETKLVVVGAGPDDWKLKLLAIELGVNERVIFTGGIDHRVIPKYLKAADIFIRPSISEGMGNSFIEAMAAGLPVIATPVGGIVDFLFDPDQNHDRDSTGVFCTVHDPESIVRCVQRLTEDRELCKRLIANARKLVGERYSWDLIAQTMDRAVFAKLFE